MLFFQGVLVLGYLYAHTLTHLLQPIRALLVHLGICVFGLCLLPIQIHIPYGEGEPLRPLLGIFTSSVGFQLLVLASTYPLLLEWYSRTTGSRKSYGLYLANNIGCAGAVTAYPLLVEPYLGLELQNEAWSGAFLVIVVLLVVCNLLAVLNRQPLQEPRRRRISQDGARIPWLLLSFCPASLSLGLTTYLSSQIAPIALLWMTPLLFYTLSFIVAFSNFDFVARAPIRKTYLLLLLLALVISTLDVVEPLPLILPLHFAVVFCGMLLCHLKLAQRVPEPRDLTLFYLYISLGAAFGAAFNTLIAPSLFSTYTEYPLMLVMAGALSYIGGHDPSPAYFYRNQAVYTVGVVLAGAGVIQLLEELTPDMAAPGAILTLGVLSLIVYSYRGSAYRFISGCLAILLAGKSFDGSFGRTITTTRNFFGPLHVSVSPDHRYRYLIQGGAIHGMERIDARTSCFPLGYYSPTGPAGSLLSRRDDSPLNIAVLGLEVGSLVCYGIPGDHWRFFDINSGIRPLVQKHFSFLDSRPEVSIDHVASDGRLGIERRPEEYDIIIVDTYSSDSVPLHYVTVEAIQTYVSKLKNVNSFILLHLSNRFLDLPPIVAAGAHQARLRAFVWNDDQLQPAELEEGKLPSRWMILMQGDNTPERFYKGGESVKWQEVNAANGIIWSDDYVNILAVLK